jgi:16S rRNA (uracil1498-N3)-methyltransferase
VATGPHVFVPYGRQGDTVTLSPDDGRHLARVLRARRGDPVSVSDGAGTVWQARVAAVAGDDVTVELGDQHHVAARAPRMVVVHALPKQRKLDDVVQRLVEIGVDEIRPVHSARSQVVLDGAKADKAVQRWRAVAHAAAKQSRRAWLPVVSDVGAWAEAFGAGAAGVVCWEESRVPLREVLAALGTPAELVVGVGPEGGLTPKEVQAAGLPHATLGPTVLRTETAALVAVAAVRYEQGLFS